MAANGQTLRDEDGDYSDWLELYNPDNEAVDLTGWYLTDDPTNKTRWRFSNIQLEAGNYLTVFASGKDRPGAPGFTAPHTDFRLSGQGEYLALVHPNGATVAHEYSPNYPEQLADVSYGVSHVSSTVVLVGADSAAAIRIPDAATDVAYGTSWTGGDEEAFAGAGGSAGWLEGAAAVGFAAEYDDWTATDLSDSMRDINTSVYVRIPFDVEDPEQFTSLALKMRYDDGFVAYLNGTRLASAAAPPSITWSSAATANRLTADALSAVEFDLTSFRGLLKPGTNILAFHGLNAAGDGANFLLAPELVGATFNPNGSIGFFPQPTPGGPNSSSVLGFLPEPDLILPGSELTFYTEPVVVQLGFVPVPPLTTAPYSAGIYYTLDGSVPTTEHGTPFSAPITIDRTTVLRAAAFADGFHPSRVFTRTFLFSDVSNQPEMDTLNYGRHDALTNLPSLSLALDPADLFGTSGIYTQFDSRNTLPERPVSVEYFEPGPCQQCEDDEVFHIDAGVRVDGSGERGWPKKSFRLRFRQEYGAARLEFPLFGDSALSTIDTLVLRAAAHDSWLSPFVDEGASATYLRDEFVRRTQAALGQPSPPGTFVHLYLNGTYWGLYNAVVRPDEFFAASEFGGLPGEYDVLKNGKYPNAEVSAGDRDAWDAMLALAAGGLAGDEAYSAIQQFLDVDNLIDYLITNIYSGTRRWLPDHWYAIRHRSPEGRFRFFSWDAESSVAALDADVTAANAPDSPGFLFDKLQENAQFRLQFADRVHAHFFGAGPLTPQATQQRWQQLVAEVSPGIAAEAARWGNERRAVSNSDRDFWAPEVNWLSSTYFPQRSAVVLAQIRALGLYPDVTPPAFNSANGTITDAFELAMSAPQGSIYYTLDGSDPRLPHGGISPTARLYSGPVAINGQTRARAAALVDGQWSAASEVHFSPAPASLRITELMYRPAPASEPEREAGFDDDEDFEFIELSNVGPAAVDLASVRLTGGVRFDFSRGAVTSLAPGESLLVVNNTSGFRARYGFAARIAGEYDGRLSNAGERLSLELVRPFAVTIQAFEYSDEWRPETDGGGRSLVAISPTADALAFDSGENWRPSFALHGTPGADGRWSLFDLVELQRHFGQTPSEGADLTGDGVVDRRDIAALLRDFGYPLSYPRDATPPVGPTLISAPPVTAGPTVVLSWPFATDDESGIAGYRIYRDNRLIGSVESTETSFADRDVAPAFLYRYEVAAINGHGVEGAHSQPRLVRLPTIASVTADSSTSVRVTFTEAITIDTAEWPANYQLGGQPILAAQREPGGKSVLLTTSALEPGHSYRLSVSGIVNDLGYPIVPQTEVVFVAGPISADIAAPRITDVSVASGEWTTPFLNRLAADGMGQGGVSLFSPGAPPVLPWTGLDHVIVRFSEDVQVGIGDLAVTGISLGHYDIASYTYNPATFTATWHLRQPLLAEHLSLTFNPRIADLAGNAALPLAGPLQASILTGDIDQDRDVDRADFAAQFAGMFSAAAHAEYSPRYDLDGSGKVTVADSVTLRNARNNLLPARQVRITEFMALNDATLVDDDGDASDWIEIYNADTTPINLGGWHLTDDVQVPDRWRFPEVVLAPGEFLVVYASGKDRAAAGQPLHTSFSLGGDGEYLALVQPDGVTVASEFSGVGAQSADVSYGWSSDSNRQRHFAVPTPGAANPVENHVKITEFMAVNHATLADSEGDYPDWIEIRNFGPLPEHLGGWTLENGGAQWTIPPLTLGVGEFRLVFASRNNRTDPESELHANFALDGDGENLALIRPDGIAVSNFAAYPAQREDVSYGLAADGSVERYFSQPTPGAANPADDESVHFSVPRGYYDRPFPLTLTTDWLDAEIRYTLDGTLPTATHGLVFDPLAPLHVGRSTTIRAVAITPGATLAPTTQTYVFLGDVLTQTGAGQPDTWGVHADYEVDPSAFSSYTAEEIESEVFRSIPSVSLVLDGDDLYSHVDGIYAYPHPMFEAEWDRPGSLEFLPAASDTGTSFAAPGRIEITGRELTRVSHLHAPQPKLSFRVAFDSPLALGPGSADPFADSPATTFDSVVFRSAYEDSWLSVNGDQRTRATYIRDAWMRATQRAMGQPAVDGRFVHLYLNGLYWGVYSLTEDAGARFAAEHLGGQPEDYDVVAGRGAGMTTEGHSHGDHGHDSVTVIAGDPDAQAWQILSQLAAGDLANPAEYAALAELLDIESFIDYVLLDLYAYGGDPNGLMTSKDPNQGWFAVRSHTGESGAAGPKFQFFAWDNEVILGAGDEDWLADRISAPSPSGTGGLETSFDPYTALDNLRRNAEFAQAFADRAHQHLSSGGALSTTAAANRFDNLAEEVAAPLAGEAGRWGDHRRDLDPSETGPYDELDPGDAEDERARLDEEFFRERGPFFFLGQLREGALYSALDAPTVTTASTISAASGTPPDAISQHPPISGMQVTLFSPAGAMYYTLDGSDPRSAGGGISASARVYSTPVALGNSAVVTARAKSGDRWSPMTRQTVLLDQPPSLRITEVMYHPTPGPPGSPFMDDDFEFLELRNVGLEPIDLRGMRFTAGIEFAFDDATVSPLAPGQRILLVRSVAAFTSRYGGSLPIAGEFSGQLNNGGDELVLVDRFGQTALRLAYDDAWQPITDGQGFSLVATDEAALPADLSTPRVAAGHWISSQFHGGSPGADEPSLRPGDVVISEIFASAEESDPLGDWVELHNTTSAAIDLSGWFLSDAQDEPTRYRLPNGTSIAAGGYLLLSQRDHFGFGLDRDGDDLYLSSGDAQGRLGGFRQQASFARLADGVSVGRHVTSQGAAEFVPMQFVTPGQQNAPPRVGPIIISEIHYAPIANGEPSPADEFIELANTTDAPVRLEGWALSGGVDFEFPAGMIVPPRGWVLVVAGDPDDFRNRHDVDPAVFVLGPFSGNLNNGGETLELLSADDPGFGNPSGERQTWRVDHVSYDNETPWPMRADGFGASLGRIRPASYGNDVASWSVTRGPTPGAPNWEIDVAPRGVPYEQSFSSPEGLDALDGWTFSVRFSNPASGGFGDQPAYATAWQFETVEGVSALVARQAAFGPVTQEATLRLDLSSHATTDDLALDFRVQVAGNLTGDRVAKLLVSGDGRNWSEAASFVRPRAAESLHYAIDLDRLLKQAQIAPDGDVYVRFLHTGHSPDDVFLLDDVRASTLDFFGPRVIAHDAGSAGMPLSTMTFAFDEPVDPTTFTPHDVILSGPAGGAIVPTQLESLDGRIWRIDFDPQSLKGDYRFSIGPNITDLAGNSMTQSGVVVSGISTTSGTYGGVFTSGPIPSHTIPFTADFAACELTALVDWGFAATGSGAWEVLDGGPEAGCQLVARQSAAVAANQDAVVRVDLSGAPDANELELDFYLERIGSESGNSAALYISPDGVDWRRVYGLNPPLAVRTHFSFDLTALVDQHLPGAGPQSDLYVRFSHVGSATGDEIRIDHLRVGQLDALGPRVASATTSTSAGSMESVEITFDQPLDPTSFSADDASLVVPSGAIVTPVSIQSIDNRVWTLGFAPQSLKGPYRILISPSITDAAGHPMNQDGDPIGGEVGDDRFISTFVVDPTPITLVPFLETFGQSNLGELTGWSLAPESLGRWELSCATDDEPCTDQRLSVTQDGAGSSRQSATLALDATAWPAEGSVYLDFWAELSGSHSAAHRATLLVSGDGDHWSHASSLVATFDRPTHFAFDLRLLLSEAGISVDQGVFVQWAHFGATDGDALHLSAVRVGLASAFGPRIESHTPAEHDRGASRFVLTFDSPIDPTSFSPLDVTIYMGDPDIGDDIDFAASAIEPLDDRNFAVHFATPTLGGPYRVVLRPNLRDLAGVPLNQNGDALAGDLFGDRFAMTFELDAPAQGLPYYQGFESGSFQSLSGWTFEVMGEFDAGSEAWEHSTTAPHTGSQSLVATQSWDCWTDHDAVLALDLSTAAQATDLVLEFWLRFDVRDNPNLSDRRSVRLRIRGDAGQSWIDATGDIVQTEGEFIHYRFDLDELLAQHSIAPDSDVYFDFNRRGFHKRSNVTLDDIGVFQLGGAPLAAPSPAVATSIFATDRAPRLATRVDRAIGRVGWVESARPTTARLDSTAPALSAARRHQIASRSTTNAHDAALASLDLD